MSHGALKVAGLGAVAALFLLGAIYLFGGGGHSVDTVRHAHPVATSADVPVAGVSTSGAASVPRSSAVVPGTRVGSPALTQAQADVIASSLASGDTGRVTALLAGGVRATYEASPGPILAPGETLRIGAADVRVTGVGRAVGLVRSHGAAGETRWALGLVLEDGQWKVLTMVKADTP
jgi:hypothetical protein